MRNNKVSVYAMRDKVASAQRLFAGGHHRSAALQARAAFIEAQRIRVEETKAYVERMQSVLSAMEDINAVLKAVKEEVCSDEKP